MLSEKLGRGSRTVDVELDAQIEILRDNKRKYQHVIRLAQMLASQLSQMIQTQKQLGDAFSDLSLKSPELHVSPRKHWQESVFVCVCTLACMCKYSNFTPRMSLVTMLTPKSFWPKMERRCLVRLISSSPAWIRLWTKRLKTPCLISSSMSLPGRSQTFTSLMWLNDFKMKQWFILKCFTYNCVLTPLLHIIRIVMNTCIKFPFISTAQPPPCHLALNTKLLQLRPAHLKPKSTDL